MSQFPNKVQLQHKSTIDKFISEMCKKHGAEDVLIAMTEALIFGDNFDINQVRDWIGECFYYIDYSSYLGAKDAANEEDDFAWVQGEIF